MRISSLLASAAVGGVAATLLTYLYNATPSGLVGAEWYGLPLVWIRRLIVAPQFNPWAVDYPGLGADLMFWTVLVGLFLYFFGRFRTR